MLENDSGGSSVATNKHAETPVLQTFKGLDIGSGEMRYGQTIFELWADKGGVDAGTEEKGKAIAVDTDIVKKTHQL